MSTKTKFFVLFFIIVILSIIISPHTGRLYEIIIGHRMGSWIGSCPECITGFVLAFSFLSGLLFFGLLKKNRINISLPFVLIFPLALLLSGLGDAFLISLGFGLVGLGLGQIVHLLRKNHVGSGL